MSLSIELKGLKPISLNNCYTMTMKNGKPRRFPSAQYKKFESLVNLELRKFKRDLSKFNLFFDLEKNYIIAEYRFYMPIIKKAGGMNQKSGDLSNLVKALEDILFKSLFADDSHVASLSVYKIHSETTRTEISFKVGDIKNIS